jgi:hypothetical protein
MFDTRQTRAYNDANEDALSLAHLEERTMERARLRIGVSLLMLLLLLGLSIPAVAQTRPVVLELVTIDNFDDEQGQQWAVYGSKFSNADYPQTTYVSGYPEALRGHNVQNAENLRVLGVHAKWDRKGYNYFELVPVSHEGGTTTPQPIAIEGKASRIDLWVWGGNYDYYMEVHLLDFRGVPHTIPIGDLNFTGWRNLSAEIPPAIPQFVKWIPQDRPLQITKIVVWTRPQERVDDFYIYLDQLQVLTDVAEARFDGDQLAQPDFLQQAWSDARGQGE